MSFPLIFSLIQPLLSAATCEAIVQRRREQRREQAGGPGRQFLGC
ncbi:hypothetical protein D3OALGB2SA_3168 [Olavius algarvensis associated proteobacterium Delta 3]|nr:hypothetical protein D3OALGB2SA_3168 [Olavius algarvensis associated proteobacterium Delta 3]